MLRRRWRTRGISVAEFKTTELKKKIYIYIASHDRLARAKIAADLADVLRGRVYLCMFYARGYRMRACGGGDGSPKNRWRKFDDGQIATESVFFSLLPSVDCWNRTPPRRPRVLFRFVIVFCYGAFFAFVFEYCVNPRDKHFAALRHLKKRHPFSVKFQVSPSRKNAALFRRRWSLQ